MKFLSFFLSKHCCLHVNLEFCQFGMCVTRCVLLCTVMYTFAFAKEQRVDMRKSHAEILNQSYRVIYIWQNARDAQTIEINIRRRNLGRNDKMHRAYCANARCNRNAAVRPLEKCIWFAFKFTGWPCLAQRACSVMCKITRDIRLYRARAIFKRDYFCARKKWIKQKCFWENTWVRRIDRKVDIGIILNFYNSKLSIRKYIFEWYLLQFICFVTFFSHSHSFSRLLILQIGFTSYWINLY